MQIINVRTYDLENDTDYLLIDKDVLHTNKRVIKEHFSKNKLLKDLANIFHN